MRARTSGHAILIRDEGNTDPRHDGRMLAKPYMLRLRFFFGKNSRPLVRIKSSLGVWHGILFVEINPNWETPKLSY